MEKSVDAKYIQLSLDDIKKVKGGKEDLLLGIGQTEQVRGQKVLPVTALNVSDLNGVLAFDKLEDLKRIDVNILGKSRLVMLAGMSDKMDKLGGLFIWDEFCVDKPDDKCIIKTDSNNSGRFIRIDNKYLRDIDIDYLASDSIINKGNITSKSLDTSDITSSNVSSSTANITNLYITQSVNSLGNFNHSGNFVVEGEIRSHNIEAENIIANNININNFAGDVSFEGNINASDIKSNSINSSELVTDVANINKINSDVIFGKNVKINGKLILNDLESGDVVIPQNLEINTLKTAGNVNIEGELYAKNIRGINFTRDDDTGKEIVVIDSIGISNDIVVNGKSTMNDDLVINGSIASSGKLAINNTITATDINTGSIDAVSLSLKNNASIIGDVNVLGDILPKDNKSNCGGPSNRFKTIWSVDGVIQTSDDRTKDYLSIEEREYKASKEMLKALRKFRRVCDKEGKIHFGVSAQEVKNILHNNGLDPLNYAFLVRDFYGFGDDIKDIYSINYTELYAFIMLSLNKD